ncbi:aldolase [Auriculariales sp. MPI-PUGE-AT-0066]|nr:aldolase [Auriculariales sp. MPI-PUGE-AT-0066]
MQRHFTTRLARTGIRHASASASATANRFVRIVEVGPRDGLQNEKTAVSADVKVSLINRLRDAGLRTIEAGSFVSPKWVPQMAGTPEVLKRLPRGDGSTAYPVLVPNARGLQDLLALRVTTREKLTDEVAVFSAASDAFCKANTNCTVKESLERIEVVVSAAREKGFRVRGYVSTVITCPYQGKIDPEIVRDVAAALLDMGCYEVSLGDTTGAGTPRTMSLMLNSVIQRVPVEKLAAHNHDTFGMGVANVMTALETGVRVIDSSVAGLGGCPYSPGATGNVATEDVVHALHGSGFETGVDLAKLVQTGEWISKELGKRNESRAGVAWLAKAKREEQQQTKNLEGASVKGISQ